LTRDDLVRDPEMKFKTGLLAIGLTLFTAMAVTIVVLRSPPALASRIRRLGGEVRLIEHPGTPQWLQPIEKLCGPFKRFHSISFIRIESDEITNEHLKEIAGCPDLLDLLVESDSITDDGVLMLANHQALMNLHLSGKQITDRGAAVLGDLRLSSFSVESDQVTGQFLESEIHPGLVAFGVSSTKFTDSSVPTLLKLQQLNELSLSGSRVSDESIDEIASIQHLAWIDLSETRISEEGVAALKKARPRVRVIQWD